MDDPREILRPITDPPVLVTMKKCSEMILRLPGLLMVELVLRGRHGFSPDDFAPAWTKEFVHNKLVSFLEVVEIVDFVRSRNLDQSAAHILQYAIIFLSSLFLLLPISRLIALYLNAFSFFLLSFAHYMSARYVQLEMDEGGEIILDDFTKVERHGFHFLAQVMIALTVCCVLRIESALARASLAIYTAPIAARLCGCPPDKLNVAHNFSCCFCMLIICFYLLNTAPSILAWLRRSSRQLRTLVVTRGALRGGMLLWRRMRIPLLLCYFWGALFVAQVSAKTNKNQREQKRVALPLVVLAALAESTATPLSLLALATTVAYASSAALYSTKLFLLGEDNADAHGVAVLHGGYTEGLTLLLLCVHAGFLELQPVQRAFLLALVLFIALSSLTRTLFEVLEPQLLALGASRSVALGPHVRALALASALFLGPLAMTWALCVLLPVDAWLLIIASSSVLTSIQTASAVATYVLFLVATAGPVPWERLDDAVFGCRAVTRILEFLVAVVVIVYGVYESVLGEWSWLSVVVIVLHTYYNVWTRVQAGWDTFKRRREAAGKINYFAKASRVQLDQLSDVCSICFSAMEEARVTPCGHFFHGACLKKWLFVSDTCPMCHSSLGLRPKARNRSPHEAPSDHEEGYSSEDNDEQSAHSDTDHSELSLPSEIDDVM